LFCSAFPQFDRLFFGLCHDLRTSILDAHLTAIFYLIRALCAANIPCLPASSCHAAT